MSSTARKDRRHLWWIQHGKQVDDDKETETPQKCVEKPSSKRNLNVKKEQPNSSAVSTSTESEKNKKARFIVFVGNLPFDLTKEDIIHHFRCIGGVTDFRLMTKKDGGTSKGCGFLELGDFVSYEKALNLHHSVIGGRKVNVEVTCGGGGSGKKRLEKLSAKIKKFRRKRGKKIKEEKEEDAKGQSNATVDSNQDKDNKDHIAKQTSNDSVVKKERMTESSQESDHNEMQKNEVKTDGKQNANKEKKRKRKHEPSEEHEKKKKQSLRESSAMESIVKDLELDSLVIKKKKQKTRKKEINS